MSFKSVKEHKRLVLLVSIGLFLFLAWATDLIDFAYEEYLQTQGVCIERHYLENDYRIQAKSTFYVDEGFRVDDTWGDEWEVTRLVPCDEYGNPDPPKGWSNVNGVRWLFIAQDRENERRF